MSAEFEFGIKENWDQINVITMEDRLEALESVTRAFPPFCLTFKSCETIGKLLLGTEYYGLPLKISFMYQRNWLSCFVSSNSF